MTWFCPIVRWREATERSGVGKRRRWRRKTLFLLSFWFGESEGEEDRGGGGEEVGVGG